MRILGVPLVAILAIATSVDAVPSARVFSCPAAYGQYPHEQFCNLYYECHDYTAYVFSCPYDWLFHRDLHLCDFPQNVQCNGLGISTPGPGDVTTSSPTPRTTAEGLDSTTTRTTTTRGPFTCPATDGDYPNPDDCSSYFSCTAGTPTLMHCPAGTNFNPTTGWCEVGTDFCGGGQGTEDPNHTHDPDKTTPRPFQCPPEDGLYPNPADCSTFYSCTSGNGFLMSCPPGTNFNPASEVCENGDEFCSKVRRNHHDGKQQEATTPGPTPSTWFECPQGAEDEYFVSPYNCSVYFHCTNGMAWQEVCSGGLWFDVEHEYCNWPEQVNCNAKPTARFFKIHRRENLEGRIGRQEASTLEVLETSPAIAITTEAAAETTTEAEGTRTSQPPTPFPFFDCPSDGLFANPYNCHEYFNCIFGNAWVLHCPANYVFDEEKGTCVPPSQGTCNEITGEPTPKPTAPSYTVDPTFECGADGNYAYEQNCHYYYQCSNGTPYLRRCSADLIFYLPKNRCVALTEVDITQLTCQLTSREHEIVSQSQTAVKAAERRHVRQVRWDAIRTSIQRRQERASARHNAAQLRSKPFFH